MQIEYFVFVRFVTEQEIRIIKASLPKALGEAIRTRRKNKKMTQADLASGTQKDRQYIYKIEKGTVTPNIVTIGIIAMALEGTIVELLNDL